MYCPKCGGQNSDDLAYCRECGENLKIISQVMKGHAPVAIASKLDSMIDNQNEGLRWDAIWLVVLSVILAIWTSFAVALGLTSYWIENVFVGVMSLLCLWQGGMNYLAYHRSLELRAISLEARDADELAAIRKDNEKALADRTGIVPDDNVLDLEEAHRIYCRSCGTANSDQTMYCRACGFGLVFGPTRMERYLPKFLIHRLDIQVKHNNEVKPFYKSGSKFIYLSIWPIFMSILEAVQGSYGLAGIFMFSGLATFFIGGRNYLSYRRTSKPEFLATGEASLSNWQEFRQFLKQSDTRTKVGAAIVLSVLAAAMPFLFTWARDALAGLVLIPLIIWGALILNFRQFQERNHKLRLSPVSELPTIELPPAETKELESHPDETERNAATAVSSATNVRDTIRFASPPLSVTEGTTKPLHREIQMEEETPTTRELDEPFE